MQGLGLNDVFHYVEDRSQIENVYVNFSEVSQLNEAAIPTLEPVHIEVYVPVNVGYSSNEVDSTNTISVKPCDDSVKFESRWDYVNSLFHLRHLPLVLVSVSYGETSSLHS